MDGEQTPDGTEVEALCHDSQGTAGWLEREAAALPSWLQERGEILYCCGGDGSDAIPSDDAS